MNRVLRTLVDRSGPIAFWTFWVAAAGVVGRLDGFSGRYGDDFLDPFFCGLLPYAVGLLVLIGAALITVAVLDAPDVEQIDPGPEPR